MTYPIKFKLYIPGTRKYYQVRIFETYETLNIYSISLHKKIKYKKGYGPYKPIEAEVHAYRDFKLKDKLGEIIFYLGGLTNAIVVHEMTHATVYLDDVIDGFNIKKLLTPEFDEVFADTLESLVVNFWIEYGRCVSI